MKVLLYAVLCYVSFIGGLTIKHYIELNANNDFVYAPIFALAGAFVALMMTTTTLYMALAQYGRQDMLREVLPQRLVMKIGALGAASGLAIMAIVKLFTHGG
jgi:ABC-type transport system involved in cytochrome c biogenesis permease subunit